MFHDATCRFRNDFSFLRWRLRSLVFDYVNGDARCEQVGSRTRSYGMWSRCFVLVARQSYERDSTGRFLVTSILRFRLAGQMKNLRACVRGSPARRLAVH